MARLPKVPQRLIIFKYLVNVNFVKDSWKIYLAKRHVLSYESGELGSSPEHHWFTLESGARCRIALISVAPLVK